eukprot:jgi/Chrzof1/6293/Cz18g00140.t1
MAAMCDHATVVQLLTARNRDVNHTAVNGATPLHEAAEKGCAVCIQILLQAGANVYAGVQVEFPDDYGLTPLHCAAACNNAAAVPLLAAAGADVNSESAARKVAPLEVAADAGHVQVVQALLEAGRLQTCDFWVLDCTALGSLF